MTSYGGWWLLTSFLYFSSGGCLTLMVAGAFDGVLKRLSTVTVGLSILWIIFYSVGR